MIDDIHARWTAKQKKKEKDNAQRGRERSLSHASSVPSRSASSKRTASKQKAINRSLTGELGKVIERGSTYDDDDEGSSSGMSVP